MATELLKPVVRKVTLERVELVVELHPSGTIFFRESRGRRKYGLPIMAAYRFAVLADKETERAARQLAKRRAR